MVWQLLPRHGPGWDAAVGHRHSGEDLGEEGDGLSSYAIVVILGSDMDHEYSILWGGGGYFSFG